MPFDSFDLEALDRLAQHGELVEPFVICYSPARRLSGGVLGVFSIREATVHSHPLLFFKTLWNISLSYVHSRAAESFY
jgi:hypothetical protein